MECRRKPRFQGAKPRRILHPAPLVRYFSRGRCLHRPAPAAGGSVRRKHSGIASKRTRNARPYGGIAAPMRSAKALWHRGWVASGGGLFTAEKSPKRAGGCGPRSPVGPRGVHPRKRHLPSCYAPPGRPVSYCLPLPGFARASRIGQPLRLQNFPQRPHRLHQNRG